MERTQPIPAYPSPEDRARLREGRRIAATAVAVRASRLASTEVELLDALATHHDLHLWLPHPSDDLWRALSGVHGTVPRAEDTSRHCANHTLLETLGATCASYSGRCPPIRLRRIPRRRKQTRDVAGLAAVRYRRQRDPARGRFSPRTTARCRCTPVTARRGRLTCCARCCSGCLTTTRRWSRATSW
ncbi:exodeoxyribonuclease V, gamma subunit [Mycobacterium xenopi 4042]|uniref:Exodeoxyribonuclease V, gamma subunit n=1 Tax=Mycobacterium xenopi 4042 TaxID=1299334 RepID=X8BJ18_MYCXE|nr:exodeoxyribonuclease V, gamma subunit [Mycobacterium xenopi 4042]